MALYGYMKDKISVLSENTTLLKSSQLYISVNENDNMQQGAYLYFDSNYEKWVRSRKADHCLKHDKEH